MREQATSPKRLVSLSAKTVLGFLVFILFLFSIPIYKQWSGTFSGWSNEYLVIGETSVKVAIADSLADRRTGLSNKKELKPNEGMFFVFEEVNDHGIWMKEMNFSIDVIWINETYNVVDFVENISPDSYPETFYPDENALYILEVPAGFVKSEGIKVGDLVTLL